MTVCTIIDILAQIGNPRRSTIMRGDMLICAEADYCGSVIGSITSRLI